jgi:hypothetical protein
MGLVSLLIFLLHRADTALDTMDVKNVYLSNLVYQGGDVLFSYPRHWLPG